MILLYIVLGVFFYILFCLIIGNIKIPSKLRKYVLSILSIIYNTFWGYCNTMIAILLYFYFSNLPKGSGYEVPSSEAGFNMFLGFISLAFYLLLLIPLNIFLQKKSKISSKVYIILNLIATVLGISIFWIFLDKTQRLY